MRLALVWQLVLSALLVSAAVPTRTTSRRAPPPSQFVTTQGTQFMVNGSAIDFVATNAYWLPTLNTEQDIDFTLGNISAAGIKVVRTWAFNDVETVPDAGTWFQLVANGTTQVNTGPNGLQKLDTVVRLAEKHGIFLILTLTNNWNPTISDTAGNLTRRTTNFNPPRNALSNDYGGMDIYVRQFGGQLMHDEFYVNDKILTAFQNYTTQVVSRYVNSPAVFSWELANDPRCNSSLPATNECQTTTVTQWHATVAAHVKSVDPNHLVASGNQGFFCMDCPKLFPRVTAPPPQTSPTAGQRRRSVVKPLTRARILEERKAAFKRSREAKKRQNPANGIRIRGRWMSTETRQNNAQDMGSSFDGSQGVDSEDIINIPQIGFGTFQLFPDQNSYGVDDPNLPPFNNTVNQGIAWIQAHADMGKLFNKPVTLNGFGLVTQNNAAVFVPFNLSTPIIVIGSPSDGPTTTTSTSSSPLPTPTDNGSSAQAPVSIQQFATDQQRDDAYAQWLETGLQAGIQGMAQYQWSQANLTPGVGTAIVPTVDGTGTTPTVDGTGLSPNDGYSIQGQGQQQVVDTISQAAQSFANDSGTA